MSFRAAVKDLALAAAERTSAYRLLGTKFAGIATIFVLHRVISEKEIVLDPALAVSEAFLDAALGYVIGKGHKVVTVSELHRRAEMGQVTPHMVAFTFDDGYRDNAARAFAVFEKHRVPWSLYLTTGFPDLTCPYWWGALERVLMSRDSFDLEVGGRHRSFRTKSVSEKRAAFRKIRVATAENRAELSTYLCTRYGIEGRELLRDDALSWAEIRRLAASGSVELGAHTVTHPLLTRLDADDVRKELRDCRSRIREMTGIEVQHFAYPYGAAGAREHALAREAGFTSAATAINSNTYAPLAACAYALPRLLLDGQNEKLSQLDIHLSGLTGVASLRTRHPLWKQLRTRKNKTIR